MAKRMESMRLGVDVNPGCHNVDESDRKAQRAMAAATVAARNRHGGIGFSLRSLILPALPMI